MVRRGRRGLYTSFQQMSVAGGSLLGVRLAALLTSAIGPEANNDWGWRIPFLLGGLFGPIGLWLRREVDETPPFRDSLAEGEAAEASTLAHAAKAFGFTVLWTVSFYVFLTYMPTYTRTQLHLTAGQSLWASTASLLALVILVPLVGALSDRIGRNRLLLGSCALCFIIPVPAFCVLIQRAGFATVVLIQMIFPLLFRCSRGRVRQRSPRSFQPADVPRGCRRHMRWPWQFSAVSPHSARSG